MEIMWTDAEVAGWGSDWSARRVSGLTPGEREHVRQGGVLLVRGPEYMGVRYRMIVESGGRFYTRMPTEEIVKAIDS